MTDLTIEAQVAPHLNTVLQACLKQRTELGVQKYGQRLEDNDQPQRAKAVHLIQELMDAAQYAAWMGQAYLVRVLGGIANDYQEKYDLTAEEIMSGGKQ